MNLFKQWKVWSEANNQKNLGAFAVFTGSYLTGGAIRNLWRWKLTYMWVALILFAYVQGYTNVNAVVVALVMGAFSVVHFGGYFYEPLWKFSMFHGEAKKLRDVKEQMIAEEAEFSEIYDFLVKDANILPADVEHIESWFEEDENRIILHWRDKVTGQTDDQIAQRLMNHKRDLKTRRAEIREDDDMFLDIVFFKKDPLDESSQIYSPNKVDLKDMSAPVGVNSQGEVIRCSYKDKAISLVGGQTGAGKTAALTGFVSAFVAQNEAVELHVIDNKAGDDWSAFEPVADTFMRVDGFETTLDDVYAWAEKLFAEMRRRTRTNLANIGSSSFWAATPQKRADADLRFILAIVDECQEIFDKEGKDRDELVMIGKITKLFKSLAKMGRSVGIHVMFVTQKPTADAIPSSITGQAGIRWALRVDTAAAELSILGESGMEDLNSPRAISIPKSRQGGAVFATDEGKTMGRFYYFHEDDQRAYLEEYSRLHPQVGNREIPWLNDIVDSEETDGGFKFEGVDAK